MIQIYISRRGDRIGMRLYAVIRTIYYCQQKKLNYNHVSVGHDNRANYKIYNNLFNFNKKYKGIELSKNVNTKYKINNIGGKWSLIRKFDININYNTRKFIKYRKSLIKLYKTSSLHKNVFKKKHINICIHYRRGDIARLRRKRERSLRYTPDNYINQIITKLNKYMDVLPLNIHIHSDSKLSMDKLLTAKHNFKVYTHFDDSAYDSLNSMIQCDILFRYGISSFSGVAAFYNNNVVISKMKPAYVNLYNYSNQYDFSNCDNILKKQANKYKVMIK